MTRRSRPERPSGGRSESGKSRRGNGKPASKTGDRRDNRDTRSSRFEKKDDSFGKGPRQKSDGEKPASFGAKRTSSPKRTSSAKRSDETKRPFRKEKTEDAAGTPRKTPYRPFDRQKSSTTARRPPAKTRSTREKDPQETGAPSAPEKIRLNKYISNSGVCSRREADELIKMGVISVNGKTITELGYKVDPGDVVRHESKILKAEKPVYILLNKPKGFLTTTKDPQERNTVMHIIANAVKERVYPVGRLDRNTTGLLLLTNDGELAEKLMHPSYNVKKIYRVELDRPMTKADAQKILDGVQLEEGKAQVDDLAIISDDKKTVGIELHIGWNRVVRRIFEALDYEVKKLDRSVYAGLDKKELGRGQWRFLTKEELIRLKHYK